MRLLKYPVRHVNEFRFSRSCGIPQSITAVSLARSGRIPCLPTCLPANTTSAMNKEVFCGDSDRSSWRTRLSIVRSVVIFSVKSSPATPPLSVNNSTSVPTKSLSALDVTPSMECSRRPCESEWHPIPGHVATGTCIERCIRLAFLGNWASIET
jgi:hypothetical protein